MDTLAFSSALADRINAEIEESELTKQQVSKLSGIPWATLCRRLGHPEKSFFTIPETISICDALGLKFIDVLEEADRLASCASSEESTALADEEVKS